MWGRGRGRGSFQFCLHRRGSPQTSIIHPGLMHTGEARSVPPRLWNTFSETASDAYWPRREGECFLYPRRVPSYHLTGTVPHVSEPQGQNQCPAHCHLFPGPLLRECHSRNPLDGRPSASTSPSIFLTGTRSPSEGNGVGRCRREEETTRV